jgi:hypothetical protein
MSWYLTDKDGFVGDFATNVGIEELRNHKEAPAALIRFLDEGEANEELVEQLIEGCKGKEGLNYIAELLEDVNPPVSLTDGTDDPHAEDVEHV